MIVAISENVSKIQRVVDLFMRNPFLALPIFVVVCFVLLSIVEAILKANHKKEVRQMTYQDFLKSNIERKLEDNEVYSDRLYELTRNKNLEEIKEDISKSSLYKDIFEEVYGCRIYDEVEKTPLDDILTKLRTITSYNDREIYTDAISNKIENLSKDELAHYMSKREIEAYHLFEVEYAQRLKEKLLAKSTDELIAYRETYKDIYLSDEVVKNIIDGIIEYKARKLEQKKVEELESKIDDLELYNLINMSNSLNNRINNNDWFH